MQKNKKKMVFIKRKLFFFCLFDHQFLKFMLSVWCKIECEISNLALKSVISRHFNFKKDTTLNLKNQNIQTDFKKI